MRFRLSVSLRLTLWYALTLALLLGGFAGFSYARFHEGLHRDFDYHLAHETRALRPFVVVEPEGPAMQTPERIQAVAIRTGGTHGTYVRLLDARGGVRYQSPNFEGMPPLTPPALGSGTRTFSQPWNGMPARTLLSPVQEGDGPVRGWLAVTAFEWSMHQELDRLGNTLALGTLVGMALALLGGFWLSRRALLTVARMTDAANQIGATDVRARIPVANGVQDELTDLAHAFNGLIERLDEAVQREKRFAANAAHELLTPLATLRAEAEVTLRRERSPEHYRRVLEATIEDSKRLSQVVNHLLVLARAEQPPAVEATDLSALARAVAGEAAERAARNRIAVEVEAPGRVSAPIGEALARTLVSNLLDNALKYTPDGGRVRLRVTSIPHEAIFEVTDTGIGLSEEDRGRVFERFFRAPSGHSHTAEGSGLGLAVAQAIARAHGGEIHASSPGLGQGSTFTARLPRADA